MFSINIVVLSKQFETLQCWYYWWEVFGFCFCLLVHIHNHYSCFASMYDPFTACHTYIPSFMKVCSGVQNLFGGDALEAAAKWSGQPIFILANWGKLVKNALHICPPISENWFYQGTMSTGTWLRDLHVRFSVRADAGFKSLSVDRLALRRIFMVFLGSSQSWPGYQATLKETTALPFHTLACLLFTVTGVALK